MYAKEADHAPVVLSGFLYGIYTYLNFRADATRCYSAKQLMSHVIFEWAGIEFRVESGARLLDVLDEVGTHGLPIACRGANCGTCRVRVLQGEHALEPPTAAEQKLLALCGAQRNERLGCQICVSTRSLGERVRIERST